MFEFLTGHEIYNSVVMKRGASVDRIFLLVEGKTEYELLAAHIEDWIELENCHGCENLDAAIRIAAVNGDDFVAALRDRDWFGVLHEVPEVPNLFLTEMYDLDASIYLTTDAGRRIVRVFAPADELASWESSTGKVAEEAVVELAAAVGYARLASERGSMKLRTEGTPLSPPVTDALGQAVLDELASMIRVRTSECQFSSIQILDTIIAEREAEDSPGHRLVCCGHDIGRALFQLIRGVWRGNAASAEFLLQAMRSALAPAELAGMPFAPLVDEWAMRMGKPRAWRT